ncbi:MAG: hypothetical protein RMN51_08525 [Verrucomicrobiota bacterium]|nr:hypothetical protein [Verrucomicrobiota bacterium]
MDTSIHPPVVREFHCLVDMMPRSAIWRVFACVIVSHQLATRLQQHSCSGCELKKAICEPSEAFFHFYGKSARLPDLHWCVVTGKAYVDDVGLAEGWKLIVSDKVKQLIEAGEAAGVSFLAGEHPPSDDEIRAKTWADAAKVAEALKSSRKPSPGWFAPPKL